MANPKVSRRGPIVVVDADAIVAQAHPTDANHDKAVKIAQSLKDSNAQMIYPVTAIYEAVTVLQHKLSSTATAYGTAVIFTDPTFNVVDVNQKTIARSVKNYFEARTSKKNTLFDCTILDMAAKYKAHAIFSFDSFYKKRGFKLAQDL